MAGGGLFAIPLAPQFSRQYHFTPHSRVCAIRMSLRWFPSQEAKGVGLGFRPGRSPQGDVPFVKLSSQKMVVNPNPKP